MNYIVHNIILDIETEGPVLEILDLNDYSWRRQITNGDVPNMGTSSFHAVIDFYLYLFGGNNDSGLCNSLYQLNLKTFMWSSINPKESYTIPAMASGGTVVHGHSIFFFGGIANVIEPRKHFGSFKRKESFGYMFDNGWHNYLHEYDSFLGK